jgi:hypothetical protein
MTSNVSRLADINEALTSALAPYVMRRLDEVMSQDRSFSPRLPQRCNLRSLDAHGALYAIVHNFDTVFRDTMPPPMRAAASSALAGRNALAHPVPPPDDNLTLSAIVGAMQLLEVAQAIPELERIARHRDEMMIRMIERGGGMARPPTASPQSLARKVRDDVNAPARSVDANPGGFFVYENFVWKKAVVHDGTCSHCNYGSGRTLEKSPRNGRWLGPFATKEDAWLAVRITGQPEQRNCGVCLARDAARDVAQDLVVFSGDSIEYLVWIEQNPDGFVVNSRRRFDSQYVVLHRASCRTISNALRAGYTERGYVKICAPRLDSLERVLSMMRRSSEAFSTRCSICGLQ